MKKDSRQSPGHRFSRKRRFLYALLTVGLSAAVSVSVCEIVFRILEYKESARNIYEGEGGRPLRDNRWGWRMTPGSFHAATAEYDVVGNVNALSMNDTPVDEVADKGLVRVLALGDSHTFAVGVSTPQTWPKVLEAELNSGSQTPRFRVYNAGVSGYSMHQYLLRLIDQGPVVHPQYVLLGVSYATDLYDLLPPDHGGWIYGGDAPRDYFDFDAKGDLTLRHWSGQPAAARSRGTVQRVRDLLDYSATFRYLRRSALALFIGSHVKIGGESLWPNMDVVLEKNIKPEHEYQWRLFEGLLRLTKQECDRQNARLIVVGIPYLPQVYDDVWNSTFGNNDAYSRTAAIERVRAECRGLGVSYVDALEPMRQQSKLLGHWLHYRKDAHPTAEGQRVIADTIYRSGSIVDSSRLAAISK